MSTLRVDNIQGQSADNVGKFVIQVQQATATDKVSINNTNAKCLECSFTTKGAGSKFFVSVIASIRK